MFKHYYICIMSIEKDLQQSKPFKNELQRAAVNLFFTSRYVETRLQDFHKSFGVTMKQYNILRILKGAGKPISTQLIRERMIDRMSDISRIVDRMVDKEIVSKCTNGADKRLVDISLTEKGMSLLEEINVAQELQENILDKLSIEDAKQLNTLLDKIRGYN